jgi:hypothetical protein
LFQKDFAESKSKKCIIKVLNRAPDKEVASGTFRNESMNMRIPFEIASKGVEYTNETRSKVFPFVHFEKHAEYNISN